jgi:hypothetical protein
MDRIALVEQYLRQLIKNADLEVSGRKSVLDFAARIRRDTAQDILEFVQSLSGKQTRKAKQERAPAASAVIAFPHA